MAFNITATGEKHVVLPNVESIPLLMIQFTKKASGELIQFVENRLLEEGLRVVTREEDAEGSIVLGLTTTQQQLELEAQMIRIVKRRRDNGIMEAFHCEQRECFCDTSISGRDSFGLFDSRDRSLLAFRMLKDVTVLAEGILGSDLSRILDQASVSYRRRLSKRASANTLAQPVEEHPTRCLYQVLQDAGYCEAVGPIHRGPLKEAIWNATKPIFSRLFPIPIPKIYPPTQLIQQYYGDEIGFYFGWMGFLTAWLIFPATLGVAAFVYRLYRKDDISNDEYTPFYGIITYFWAVLFLQFWERQECRLSHKWGVLVSEYEKQKYFSIRPEFYGRLRKSPITGKLEVYYPDIRRRLKYVVSALVSIIMLGVAFSTMILSLNLQGYINPNHDETRWGMHNRHPFHVPWLSVLAEPGHIFDMNSTYKSLIPVVMHVATIFTLNTIYRIVATRLTEWENHETQLGFNNSLILKRFMFEAFDCYIALFYLAFYERNIDKLRTELVSVFNIDTIRRLALECLVPMFLQRLKRKHDKKHDKKNDNHNGEFKPLVEEAELDEYEQFDDYMEIVIQFGYVTLFASAYPLASAISIVANMIEIRSDCFKLTYICQRPEAMRCDGLRVWKSLLDAMVRLSALTNCLIFGFTSGQLMQWMPYFYYMTDDQHVRLRSGKGWVLVFIIFALERCLLYFGSLIRAIVPRIPEDVWNEMERKHFVQEEESRQFEQQQQTQAANLSGILEEYDNEHYGDGKK